MVGLSVDNVMALRQSILQRNSALKDATSGAGTNGVGTVGGGIADTGGAQGTGGADFASALKNAIQGVSGLQENAGAQASAFEKGETTDIAAVMLAKQQASVGFETTLQVRNKLLSAYKDIMSMPV
ncbi:flagellar hook-basal body complex protein FliE [Sphingobium sufflavum]|uniref:flagellar hook-basal body complex protein FliE n=1 Tax=Sphingobium sufflavum TaxID=1129547 RepID=UPI001F382B05|nr:flagellar hook-basal body complex protein FliE [Sphingobium sufflavum]MCE7795622.1 flagellar hook-basal body complex protein FliE [Sphingobium sufflavum]